MTKISFLFLTTVACTGGKITAGETRVTTPSTDDGLPRMGISHPAPMTTQTLVRARSTRLRKRKRPSFLRTRRRRIPSATPER